MISEKLLILINSILDDKRKQDYYRKFAGGDWSDATNYDLCLNAGKLGFEKCVDAILAQMNVMGIK